MEKKNPNSFLFLSHTKDCLGKGKIVINTNAYKNHSIYQIELKVGL